MLRRWREADAFADSFSLSLWRQLLYPAQVGVGFGCLSDAPLALLAFV
jgi:hypothetical protein